MDHLTYVKQTLPEMSEDYERKLSYFKNKDCFALVPHQKLTFKAVVYEVMSLLKRRKYDYYRYLKDLAEYIYFTPTNKKEIAVLKGRYRQMIALEPKWIPIKEVGMTPNQAKYNSACSKMNGKWMVNLHKKEANTIWKSVKARELVRSKPVFNERYTQDISSFKFNIEPYHLGDVYVFSIGKFWECRKCDNGWRCGRNCQIYPKTYYVVPSKGLLFDREWSEYTEVTL